MNKILVCSPTPGLLTIEIELGKFDAKTFQDQASAKKELLLEYQRMSQRLPPEH